jgi:predicted enzyme related to lactoylglutathione lyase
MLRGFATISFFADDLEAAGRWYAELLGQEPYFRVGDGYLEFRVGDSEDELGIIARKYAGPGAGGPTGAITYWHVDDLELAVKRLLELGATEHLPITARGHGFATASVVDPFGNVLGVMTNPHYLETLATAPGR